MAEIGEMDVISIALVHLFAVLLAQWLRRKMGFKR